MNSLHRAVCLLLLVSLLTSVRAVAASAGPELGLTAAQRERFVLNPEHYDTWYGKADRIYLNGFWHFRPGINVLQSVDGQIAAKPDTSDPGTDEGLKQGYFRPQYDASQWEEMLVPMPWNYQLVPGKRPTRTAFAGVAYYRTEFRLPADRKHKRVFLQFDSVQTDCRVWLNGVEVGRHSNSGMAFGPYWTLDNRLWLDDFELDVTKQASFGGTNVLVLRVYDDDSTMWRAQGLLPDDGGIVGPVYVECREQIHLPEILVAPNLRKGSIDLDILATNYSDKTRVVELRADCGPFRSKFYQPPVPGKATSAVLGRVALPPGESRHHYSMRLKSPVLWDIDTPFLYHLRVTADGRAVGQTRFGFREFAVVGNRFMLNGHPVYLPGNTPTTASWESGLRSRCFNHANYLRHALQLFREANLNFLRVHNGPETTVYYDICDELGLINEDDFTVDARGMSPEETTRAEQEAEVQVDGYLKADGTFTSAFSSVLSKWVKRLHNHPSACMFSGGNEIGHEGKEQQLAAYLNAFYDFVKAQDRQHRPVTPSSGLTWWQWHTPVKTDFHDYHSYGDGEMGWAFAVAANRPPLDGLERIYGHIGKPVINGECLGYILSVPTGVQSLWRDGRIDKTAYVSWTEELQRIAQPRWWDWAPNSRYVRWKGIRTVSDSATVERTVAAMTKDVLRVFRRDMPTLEGFAPLNIDVTDFGFTGPEAVDVSEQELAASHRSSANSVLFRSLQEILSPQIATLDMYDRHQFAGRPFKATLHLLNYKYRSPDANFTVELALRGTIGELINVQRLHFSGVPEHSRRVQAIEIPLTEGLPTGDYLIEVVLLRDKVVLSRELLPLFVLSGASPKISLPDTVAVALYEKPEATSQGEKPASTRQLLDDFGVRYDLLEEVKALDRYQVLIIGAYSLDQEVLLQGDLIRSWVEKGGRLLCLEQDHAGPLPFAPGLRIETRGSSFFADLIDTDHPVLKGFRSWHWELWNGLGSADDPISVAHSKRVYDSYILPMTPGVIISGGDQGRWNANPVFGMVAGEVKLGAGTVLLSQAIATERHRKDPIAQEYLRNVLTYMVEPRGCGLDLGEVPPRKADGNRSI